jgi:hypothetical protein
MTRESRGAKQGQGGGTAEQAMDRVHEVVGDAADTAREKAATGLDEQTTRVGQQVDATASALRGTGDQLRQQGNQAVAEVTDLAAREAQRLGRYLEQTSGDQLLEDVERYARRNPWAVVLGGVVAGVAAARLVKASSSDRYRTAGAPRRAPMTSSRLHGEPVAPRPAPDVPPGSYPGMA